MDYIFTLIAHRLGIAPEMLVLYLGILVAIANVLGKTIPVSATGPLGIVRKVCLVIGLYVPQKITPNLSTKTIASSIAVTLPDEVIKSSAERLPSSVQLGMEAGDVAAALNDAIHGRTPGKRYSEGAPAQDSIVPDEFRTDGPFAEGKGKRR